MDVARIGVTNWPTSPEFFIKGSSYPISEVEADRMYSETLKSQNAELLEPTLTQVESYQYWAIILAVFPIITVFGNVLVILSVFRETNLHTATNYFIVSLAGADIGLALFVMPLSVWVEANNGNWRYGTIFCDVFIMLDVMLCTASILNLAAISMDRYVAVTNPIVYNRHNNNFRVGLTITLVWILSFVIALPIACGLNNVAHRQKTICVLYNPEYIITSSIGSFYMPCVIMIILYYRVFHAIRGRTKGIISSTKQSSTNRNLKEVNSTVASPLIENTQYSPATDSSKKNLHSNPKCRINPKLKSIVDQSVMEYSTATAELIGNGEERSRITETANGSEETFSIRTDSHDDSKMNFNVTQDIVQLNGTKLLTTEADEIRTETSEVTQFQDMEHFRKHLRHRIKLAKRCSLSVLPVQYSTVSGQQVFSLNKISRKSGGSFTSRRKICNKLTGSQLLLFSRCSMSRKTEFSVNEQRKIRSKKWGTGHRSNLFRTSNHNSTQGFSKDRMSAKRERKATKTLAIVLGVFLICWIPFFTLNVTHAFCFKYETLGRMSFCHLPKILDSVAVWLGYINSFLNPIIYTIFNVEFRKSFKKLLHC